MRFIVLSIAALTISTCKSRAKSTDSESKSLFGSTIDAVIDPDALKYERYQRNKDRPWVAWQWLPGTRNDFGESKDLRVSGVIGAASMLDAARANMVTNNLIDTNGLYGSGGSVKFGSVQRIWIELRSGKTCDSVTGVCEDVVACGPANISNPNYRARTLTGICNDFDNPMMGAAGMRMARNASIKSVNLAQSDFGDGERLPLSNPDEISQKLMLRKDPHNFNPAPHFNLWAAAWIQFNTHDWFDHSRQGENDLERSITMPDGRKVTATIHDDQSDLRGKGEKPTKTFKNKVTHWWDASQLYGWDKSSQGRVRNGAYMKLTADGMLPMMKIDQYGNTQESAAFVENWWVGMNLLHTLFSRHHNWLVDELRKQKDVPGGGDWTDDKLFDTARLITSAMIAKIHTTEWTPQLLFDNVGNAALQGNWHGLLNYDFDREKGFDQTVQQTFSSEFASKVVSVLQTNFPCSTSSVSLLASLPGITRLGHQEHFCSPFSLPEEFTSVYRLHSMIPDTIETYRLADHKFEGSVETKDLVADKGKAQVDRLGMDDWAATFGLHPAGQIVPHNFPKFLGEIDIPAAPKGKINLASMDLLRDRERGVPRFNEFRRQIGLKPLKSFDDFVDIELAWEIKNKMTRDALPGSRALNPDQVQAKQAQLNSQKQAVADLKAVYKGNLEDVDLQVGIAHEFARPHGFVISETQFQIFILNASRRIFSDRFFTEAFNDKYYTKFGINHVQGTTMIGLLRQHFPKIADVAPVGKNAFELWDRKVEGFSLCPDNSSWFASHPDVDKAYRDLLCVNP